MHHTDGLPRRDAVWWSVGGNSLEARFWIASGLPTIDELALLEPSLCGIERILRIIQE